MLSCFIGIIESWILTALNGTKLVMLAAAGNLFALGFAAEADPAFLWNYLKIMLILYFIWKVFQAMRRTASQTT
jgi:hypothetical protein